jgi:hypothetical protein
LLLLLSGSSSGSVKLSIVYSPMIIMIVFILMKDFSAFWGSFFWILGKIGSLTQTHSRDSLALPALLRAFAFWRDDYET